MNRRTLLGGLVAALGGTPPMRPDQEIDPPATVLAPGGASGVFRGRLVVVFGTSSTGASGVFVYSPTPGKNNLIYSIVPAAGHDSYGNTVFAGATSYTDLTGVYSAVAVAAGNGVQPGINFFTSPGDQTSIYSVDFSMLDLALATGINGLSLSDVPIAAPPSCWNASLLSIDPVALNVPESWHNMPAMSGGWSNSHAKYRLTSEGNLQLSFRNLGPGTDTDGATIWAAASLPAAYQPVSNKRIACYSQALRTGAAAEAAALEVITDGSVQCFGIAAASTRVDLEAVVALDI